MKPWVQTKVPPKKKKKKEKEGARAFGQSVVMFLQYYLKEEGDLVYRLKSDPMGQQTCSAHPAWFSTRQVLEVLYTAKKCSSCSEGLWFHVSPPWGRGTPAATPSALRASRFHVGGGCYQSRYWAPRPPLSPMGPYHCLPPPYSTPL
jgi:hypothetical protein